MEIVLNITWALASLILIGFWARRGMAEHVPRRTQLLALGMAVLLLLPVISLSDDLLALQAPAETDTCLRRAQHPDSPHPDLWPFAFALPSRIEPPALVGQLVTPLPPTPESAVPHRPVFPALDSRPPPQA